MEGIECIAMKNNRFSHIDTYKGIVLHPSHHNVNIEPLARRMKYGRTKLFVMNKVIDDVEQQWKGNERSD